jgi:hypothetical protein
MRNYRPIACQFGTPNRTCTPGPNSLREYTMKMTRVHTKHKLERYGALALREGRGSVVTCISGTIWLTMEGDTRDVVLEPGASFVVDRRGLTILAAHEASVVDVCVTNRAPRWWTRVVDFLDRNYGPAALKPARKWVY